MAAADSLPDFTGCFLDDRYELIKLLGSGSFGVVYKAIDHEIADDYDNVVAVKILRKAGRSSAHLASIKREVAFHSTVAYNEGVVTLYDTFDDEKWCYLVLEFCGGGDLFDQIITRRIYAGKDELIRRAFLSLVDAVHGCHEAGISHRDLKPENVLTNEDGSQCYLADFGLASNEPLVSEFGVGTGLYMSPGASSFYLCASPTFALTKSPSTLTECVGDMTGRRSYDPFLSDIWSLGVILLNMITGQNLWGKATAKDVHFIQFLMDPDFMYHASSMSCEAQSILLSLLEIDPAHRMSLSTLREEIMAVETFFRPASEFPFGEHGVFEHEYTISSELERELGLVAQSASASELEYDSEFGLKFKCRSAHVASEIDIPCAAASPEPAVRGEAARDCSAGSATVDFYPTTSSSSPTTIIPSSISYSKNSCSSARASSGTTPDAEEAITPEGTTTIVTSPTPTTAYMLWERMMAGAHLTKHQHQYPSAQGVHSYEGWQSGATAQTLMAQYQTQYGAHWPEYYHLY